MQVTPGATLKKTLLQRQIPTIVGLIVLVLGMIGGIWFLYQGPAVFAPRATPQTTPKNIKVTNVTDASFTVSFITDEATAGFVKYGAAANALNTQAGDDRDQLSGSVGKFTTHHVTVRGLTPNTQYFYTLGTGSNARFDNNGAPFTIKTTPRGTTPPAAKTIYGPVLNESGSPAEGSIVYVSLAGVGEMSALVKSSGSWAVTLSNARTTDGTQYATIKDTDELTIKVQGPRVNSTTSTTVTVADAQPVPQLSLGAASTQQSVQKSDDTNLLMSDQVTTDLETTATRSTGTQKTGAQATLTGADDEEADGNTNSTSSDEDDGESNATGTGGTANDKAEGELLALAAASASPRASASPTASPKASISSLIAQASASPRATASPRVSASPTASPRVSASPTASPKASGTPFGSGNPYPATTSASPKATSTATTSSKGGSSTRSAVISSSSAVPVSGAVETTLALVLGGVFFVGSGIWSYWIARQLEEAPEYQ